MLAGECVCLSVHGECVWVDMGVGRCVCVGV